MSQNSRRVRHHWSRRGAAESQWDCCRGLSSSLGTDLYEEITGGWEKNCQKEGVRMVPGVHRKLGIHEVLIDQHKKTW